ncbi:MAG TPA: 50S ribosomal protein L22 [bacterium]|nr:50S ribosomal protein L22 [bacterium]
MAEATAKLNYLRMSAQKVRLVAETIKGKPVSAALAILEQTPKRASRPLRKLLQSAVANASENHDMDADALVVKNVMVNEGPTLKRWMPRAMGRATPIRKRTSKIIIVVSEKG